MSKGVKFMVTYTNYSDQPYVVGFANSLEDFNECNNKRTYPYKFEEEHLKLVPLKTDVFSMGSSVLVTGNRK